MDRSYDNIRLGIISSINYEKGLVRVMYRDKDDAVTKELPILSFNGEYKMPNIDDMVVVLHLSNGSEMGIVLGTYWNENNKPSETGKGIYRKELGNSPGEAYLRYDAISKTVTIKADAVQFITKQNTTTM